MMTSLGLDGLSVVLNPLLPVYALAALALAFGAIFALSLWRRARGKSLRLLAGLAILAALLDPSIVKERRGS